MAKKKFKLKKWQKFAAGFVAGLLVVFLAYFTVCCISAGEKRAEYIEKYGEESLDEEAPGLAWAAVCMDKVMLSGYDEVKVSKGMTLEGTHSYSYIKYVFKANDTKYVVYYTITVPTEYKVK